MQFEHFGIVNSTAANKAGYLADDDMDCAASKPNAIHTELQEFRNPSIFRSNTTALHALNASQYFDFVSFTVKPLGPVTDFIYLDITAWTIDEDKTPTNVQSLGIGWDGEDQDYLEPWEFSPREYFEGWGEKVNWVEIQGGNEYDEPWEFTIDNLVLEFHKLDEESDD